MVAFSGALLLGANTFASFVSVKCPICSIISNFWILFELIYVTLTRLNGHVALIGIHAINHVDVASVCSESKWSLSRNYISTYLIRRNRCWGVCYGNSFKVHTPTDLPFSHWQSMYRRHTILVIQIRSFIVPKSSLKTNNLRWCQCTKQMANSCNLSTMQCIS